MERLTAMNELQDYLDGLVRAAEKEPGDDLLGRQVRKRRAEDAYDHDDLVSLAFLLLIAGHETTANATSLGIVALLENPDQLAAIRADPSLTPAAVEEVVRYFTVGDLVTTRVAAQDVEIAGVTIRAGDGVIGLGQAANFDSEAFPDPGRLDIGRVTRGHVSFSYGPHQCLGANLARLEMRIVFDTLFARLPGLRLAVPFDELPFKYESAVFGLHGLPVTW
jgi:cytochrome P450